MKPIEFYLDEILKRLHQARKKPVAEREHLNPDIILREVMLTDRHEDYLEMIQILEEAGYIRRVNENTSMNDLDKSRDILITIRGSILIESGGYTQRRKDIEAERVKVETLAKGLNRVTTWIAGGTIALVLVELINLALEHKWFCWC
jgi:hypothetical protein